MKKSVRKGFTLVELLIVIVVIGILSAMMMLSSTEAVSSARAADIISDLRNLKTATLAWYADNIDYVENGGTKPAATGGGSSTTTFTNLEAEREDILKYLGEAGIKTNYTWAGPAEGKKTEGWYVICKVDDDKVREKLESRAQSTGLLQASGPNTATDTRYSKSDAYVAMSVR